MTALAFVDTETTGLDPSLHVMWEIAVLRREEDGTETEYLWQIRPTSEQLERADPKALDVGRFHERMAVPARYPAADMTHVCGLPHPMGIDELRRAVLESLKDTVMIGSNASFDAAFLRPLLRLHRPGVPWHYRTVDVATLAAGHVYGACRVGHLNRELPTVPYSSRELSRAVGVEPPGDGVAHTAMGDARWARDVYDAATVAGAGA